MNQLTPSTIIVCIAAFAASPTLVAQEKGKPRVVYSRTQDGVTVRIEKITIERVFNELAWLQHHGGTNWKRMLSDAEVRRLLPAKSVTFFVSVVATKAKIKQFGPPKIHFPNLDRKNRIGGISIFSPPTWQPRLPALPVDPKATGVEIWYLGTVPKQNPYFQDLSIIA